MSLPTHAPSAPSLTIRFTTSDPDLILPLPSPSTTSALKHQIRALRPSLSTRKLRLIHSGRVLSDNSALPLASSGEERVWIHCSVGPVLSAHELATESSPLLSEAAPSYTQPPPAPQGFDRLLSQGFSESEVAALRAQFAALHGEGEDGEEGDVRVREDRWIDGQAGEETTEARGTFEDMFIGTAIGFFWPVMIWMAREEGVFTSRRRYAVFAGVCVNVFFGLIRVFG
jgi:hypothetical protein